MDEAARGDERERAEPKEAKPPEAPADAALREPSADAIPTIAPHELRLPPQTPPWPEETTAAGGDGDAEAEEPSSVAPSIEVSPEPHGSPVADAGGPTVGPDEPRLPAQTPPWPEETAAPDGAGDVEAEGQGAVAPASETAVPSSTPAADAVGGVEAEEQGAIEPAVETAASPGPEVPSSPVEQETPHRPVEAEVSDLVASVPPVVSSPEPLVRSEVVAGGEADLPVAASVDIFTTAPSEPADHPVQPDVPTPLDAPERPQPADMPTIMAEAQSDAEPPDEQPEPIRAEQIWSELETTELPQQSPGAEQIDTRQEAPAAADARVEPVAPVEWHTQQAALIGTIPAAMQPAPAWRSPTGPSWPSVSLPSKERVGGALTYLRLALRVAVVSVLALTAAVLLLVILYRWVDPPASTLMLGQRLGGTPIERTWVPLDRMSPNLIQAVILSEDGGFCRHRGVDWPALEEAIESSRGGSTITMQVVKNLFLWPARSYVRKALEIILAYVVEAVWPKQRVIEIYLNIAEWGPGVFGAEAAARHHFGKRASQVTAQEAALLAVSLPSPIERQAAYPDWQTRRLANNLLIRMRAVRTTMRCVQGRRART